MERAPGRVRSGGAARGRHHRASPLRDAGDSCGRGRQSFLGHACDESVANARHVALAEVVSDAERVDAGEQRPHGRLLDADGCADGLHFQGVREHDAVVPQLVAQQADHRR